MEDLKRQLRTELATVIEMLKNVKIPSYVPIHGSGKVILQGFNVRQFKSNIEIVSSPEAAFRQPTTVNANKVYIVVAVDPIQEENIPIGSFVLAGPAMEPIHLTIDGNPYEELYYLDLVAIEAKQGVMEKSVMQILNIIRDLEMEFEKLK
jgi:hypothetical protein